MIVVPAFLKPFLRSAVRTSEPVAPAGEPVIIIGNDLQAIIPIIENWGLRVVDQGTTRAGKNNDTYQYISVELPKGWSCRKKLSEGTTFITDSQGADRLHIEHFGGSVCSADQPSFHVDVLPRFDLRNTNDMCVLVDHQTDIYYPVSDNRSVTGMKHGENLSRVLCQEFNIPFNPAYHISNVTLSALWDDAVKLSPSKVERIISGLKMISH